MEIIISYLEKLSSITDKISRVLLGLIVTLMFTTIILSVFFRYVLNNSLPWPEELTMFLMGWMTFVGSAIAIKSSEHIGVDILQGLAKGKIAVILDLILKSVMLFFAFYLVTGGYNLALLGKSITAEGLGIIQFYPRLCMPVGGFLMSIHLVYIVMFDIYKLFARREDAIND